MCLRNSEKRGMPAFMLNMVSSKHGHKSVELSEFALELWEMWTGVFGIGEFVVIVCKFAVVFVFRFLGCSQNGQNKTLGSRDFQTWVSCNSLEYPIYVECSFKCYCSFQD